MIQVSLSIYLDKRRKKRADKYPVKLRIYHQYETRLYPTSIEITEAQFQDSYLTANPKTKELRELKAKIVHLEAKAGEAIKQLHRFSFDAFEKKLFRPTGVGQNVFYHYNQIIQQLEKKGQITTASSYHLSQRSLQLFLKSKGRKTTTLPFESVSVSFLHEYERWMLGEGKSRTTVGIYLRPLRAVFNNAITEGDITSEVYPFGKRKFQIPAGRNIKKALSKEELKKLFNYPAPNTYMEKAKDFWFFSYTCNGMNMRDIAELRWENIREQSLSFIRSKTKNTTKGNTIPILVPLTAFALQVIAKWGVTSGIKNDYVFPILTHTMNAKEKLRAVQAFTRFVNQHIKSFAQLAGVTNTISTYWARHSFTTMAVQNGASLEFVQESLGHSSLNTTMNYWKGFEEGMKVDLAKKLMDL